MNSMYGGRGPAGSNRPETPSGYEATKLQNFTPEMYSLFNSLFGHLQPGSYLSRLAQGDESIFQQIEKPAYRQFQEQIGGLASRFSGAGMGARRGSGFQLAGTQAATNFAEDLQAQRQNLQMQAIRDLMGLSGQLLGQRPFENVLNPKQEKPDYFGQAIGGFASAIPGAIVGGLTGGPPGAVAGGAAGFANSLKRPTPQFTNFYQ